MMDFLSDIFGLLASRNFAIMAMWRNDFSLFLFRSLLAARWECFGVLLFVCKGGSQQIEGCKYWKPCSSMEKVSEACYMVIP